MYDLNKISEYWEEEGNKYKLPHFRLHFIFDLISSQKITGKKVLDIGGGPGALKDMLALLGYETFVLDLTSNLKEDVLLHDLNYPLDITKISQKFRPASIVIVSGLLEYIENWENVLGVIKATSDQSTFCILSYINCYHPQIRNKRKFHPLWKNIRSPLEVERNIIMSGFSINKTYGVTPTTPITKKLGYDNYFSLGIKYRLMQKLFGDFIFRQYIWVVNLNENSTHISSYR